MRLVAGLALVYGLLGVTKVSCFHSMSSDDEALPEEEASGEENLFVYGRLNLKALPCALIPGYKYAILSKKVTVDGKEHLSKRVVVTRTDNALFHIKYHGDKNAAGPSRLAFIELTEVKARGLCEVDDEPPSVTLQNPTVVPGRVGDVNNPGLYDSSGHVTYEGLQDADSFDTKEASHPPATRPPLGLGLPGGARPPSIIGLGDRQMYLEDKKAHHQFHNTMFVG